MTIVTESEDDIAAAIVLQQARLIRLCTSLTGNAAVAEDLAAESLLEAWRNRHKLYNLDGLSQWLSAIARHICLRWLRKHGADIATLIPLDADDEGHEDALAEWLRSSDDVEREYESHKLAELLDHALALLPPDTRNILIEQQLYGRSHLEIAASMGISAAAVGMRLRRGKIHLRKLFANELYERAAAYDFFNPTMARWETTHIWCHECGSRHLEARFEQPSGILSLPESIATSLKKGTVFTAPRIGRVESPDPRLARPQHPQQRCDPG